MVSAVTPHLHLFPNARSLARGAAKRIAEAIQKGERKKDRISLVLSGGNTPRELYLCLASGYRDRISWGRIHFFGGDERFVPLDHPQSNCRMARECLLDPLGIPADQVHPMPTTAQNPKAAARSYKRVVLVPRVDSRASPTASQRNWRTIGTRLRFTSCTITFAGFTRPCA